MKKPWTLATQLSLILSFALVIIWVLSISSCFYMDYRQARQELITSMHKEVKRSCAVLLRQLSDSEKDAKNLLEFWRKYNQHEYYYTPFPTSIYLNYFSVPMKGHQYSNISEFIQTFGGVKKTRYLDSFISFPHQGIVLNPPSNSSAHYRERRKREIISLTTIDSNKNGFIWGKPHFDPRYGWYISIAVKDVGSRMIVGLSLRIDNILASLKTIKKQNIEFLPDDQENIFFIEKNVLNKNRLQTINLHKIEKNHELEKDYIVINEKIPMHNINYLLIHPISMLRSDAIISAMKKLPLYLLTIIVLIGTLVLILLWKLEKPLAKFINIIDDIEKTKIKKRIPKYKVQELSHIAEAYNKLLNVISNQHATQEKLVTAKQQAELANLRKSIHLTDISHEIRTPLNGIIGALELLQDTLFIPEQASLIDTAKQCADTLLGILNNLLDFSRIESGQLELSLNKTALLPLIDQVMLTIQPKAHQKALHLSTHVSATVPAYAQIDVLRVRQILLNILGNAEKFTDRGYIALFVDYIDGHLSFTVEDTGKGIDSAKLQHVFTPFYQSEPHDLGTGLGLTIALKLTNMMQGKLSLTSIPLEGTQVTLSIPAKQPEYNARLKGKIAVIETLIPQLTAFGLDCTADPHSPHFAQREYEYLPHRLLQHVSQWLSSRTITSFPRIPVQAWQLNVLLVDDITINRQLVENMLRRLGHKVKTSANGMEALALGERYIFDLVLMDIRMPLMSGREVARRWRASKSILDTECMIVALTTDLLPLEKQRIINSGINDHLAKPIHLLQLAELADKVVDHQLHRDIELFPASHSQSALLGGSALQEQLYQDLKQLISQAGQQSGRPLADTLHSINGCADLGGLPHLSAAIQQLTQQLNPRQALTRQDLSNLQLLLEQEVKDRLEKVSTP